jgi:hypothetical protein
MSSHELQSVLVLTAEFWKMYCGVVDVWSDNHVLIFYTIIYCHYAEHTDELQLDDLQVAG